MNDHTKISSEEAATVLVQHTLPVSIRLERNLMLRYSAKDEGT